MAAANLLPFHRNNALAVKERAIRERTAEAERKRQIDQAAGILDRLEARAAFFDKQIKALQARKANVCRRAESFEERTLTLMRKRQLDKFEGISRTLIARPAPASLKVDDESLIPAEYLRVKTEPMKVEIKNALARGEEIEGVRLVQNVTLVRK